MNLQVDFARSELAPAGTTAVAEVFDSRLRRIRDFTIVAGRPRTLELAPGPYSVRVTLPTGGTFQKSIVIGDEGLKTVILGDEPADLYVRPGFVRRLTATCRRWAGKLAPAPRSPDYDAALWEQHPNGMWTRTEVPLHGAKAATIDERPERHRVLAYSVAGSTDELVVLPPGVDVDVSGGRRGKDVAAKIKLANSTAEALSSYVATGQLDLATTIVDEVLGGHGGSADPALETLVGYHLIRTGDEDRLRVWRDQHREGSALPDQKVIEAWSLMWSGDDWQARDALLAAEATGPPVYNAGLRLLLDGLDLFGGEEENEVDDAVVAALKRTRTYARATDWSEQLTTFPGEHPEEPEPAPAQIATDKVKPWAQPEHNRVGFTERRLRRLLTVHAVAALGVTLFLLSDMLYGDPSIDGSPSAIALGAALTGLSAIGAGDVRRFGWFSLILAGAYAALVYAIGLLVLFVESTESVQLFGREVPGELALLAWLGAGTAWTILLWRWGMAAARATNDLKYLHPVAYATIGALAEVLVEAESPAISPEDVGRNVDRYLAELKDAHPWRAQLVLVALAIAPLLRMQAPFPAMEPVARRRFVERVLIRGTRGWRFAGNPAEVLLATARTASQLVYLGYYGDPRTWAQVGYTPFAARHRAQAAHEEPRHEPLRPLPVPPRGGRGGYDTIIVGSGAAGAVLAYSLAESGRRVLVLERGPFVTPADYKDDEPAQFARLYAGGGLQTTTNFRLQIFQGACVGGSTVLPHGIAARAPARTMEEWNDRWQAGIDLTRLEHASHEVTEMLGTRLAEAPATPGANVFVDGLHKLGLSGRLGTATANLSVLDSILGRAQRTFPGGVEVLPDCDVQRIEVRGGRAVRVIGRHGTGTEVEIPAGQVVVAAGAIASSSLLQRSRIGDGVGQRLQFNLTADVTGDFDAPLEGYEDAELAAVFAPEYDEDVLLETWRYSPLMQALSMPGWFGQHAANMRRYRHMLRVGAVIGTSGVGQVRTNRTGPPILFEPAREDESRLIEGMRLAARTLLAAGARRVMPSTLEYLEFRDEGDLHALDRLMHDSRNLQLRSWDPQGGNALGSVVDDGFRVRGTDNVYVCDASVFPSSIGVAPQLTVMALARYAAPMIAG